MSGGKFTVNFNPVGPLVPPDGSRLNDNGSHVHPQASGGFTINVNPLGQFVPLAGGGLNVNKAHVQPPAGGSKKGYESENREKGIGKFGKPISHSKRSPCSSV
ncbi:hypothetical protein F2Q69_00037665 [Brassica cretica]|uniref:Uncharacterized protein n=1 Tax=Brassica cretica TaxID=69181 RepID=A0A8S9SJQ0_BRACR|nr:hypothetical protein F2Q69_00037665 [Brassica cretica]